MVVGLLPKPKDTQLSKSASTPANLSERDTPTKLEEAPSDPLRNENSEDSGNEIKKEDKKTQRPVSISNPNSSSNSNEVAHAGQSRIQVLYKYPPDKDPPAEVLPFIFPENPQTKKVCTLILCLLKFFRSVAQEA